MRIYLGRVMPYTGYPIAIVTPFIYEICTRLDVDLSSMKVLATSELQAVE